MVSHRGPNTGTGHNHGRHIKRRRIKISRRTLARMTIALYMISAFTAGIIAQLIWERLGI